MLTAMLFFLMKSVQRREEGRGGGGGGGRTEVRVEGGRGWVGRGEAWRTFTRQITVLI